MTTRFTPANVLDLVKPPAVDVFDDRQLAELSIPARLAALTAYQAALDDAEARYDADAEARYELWLETRWHDQIAAEEQLERQIFGI